MKAKFSSKNRKQLQAKLGTILNDKIQSLSLEYRDILLDDMVTAFENRLTALSRTQSNIQMRFQMESDLKVDAV
jgi:hypothetical protein